MSSPRVLVSPCGDRCSSSRCDEAFVFHLLPAPMRISGRQQLEHRRDGTRQIGGRGFHEASPHCVSHSSDCVRSDVMPSSNVTPDLTCAGASALLSPRRPLLTASVPALPRVVSSHHHHHMGAIFRFKKSASGNAKSNQGCASDNHSAVVKDQLLAQNSLATTGCLTAPATALRGHVVGIAGRAAVEAEERAPPPPLTESVLTGSLIAFVPNPLLSSSFSSSSSLSPHCPSPFPSAAASCPSHHVRAAGASQEAGSQQADDWCQQQRHRCKIHTFVPKWAGGGGGGGDVGEGGGKGGEWLTSCLFEVIVELSTLSLLPSSSSSSSPPSPTVLTMPISARPLLPQTRRAVALRNLHRHFAAAKEKGYLRPRAGGVKENTVGRAPSFSTPFQVYPIAVEEEERDGGVKDHATHNVSGRSAVEDQGGQRSKKRKIPNSCSVAGVADSRSVWPVRIAFVPAGMMATAAEVQRKEEEKEQCKRYATTSVDDRIALYASLSSPRAHSVADATSAVKGNDKTDEGACSVAECVLRAFANSAQKKENKKNLPGLASNSPRLSKPQTPTPTPPYSSRQPLSKKDGFDHQQHLPFYSLTANRSHYAESSIAHHTSASNDHHHQNANHNRLLLLNEVAAYSTFIPFAAAFNTAVGEGLEPMHVRHVMAAMAPQNNDHHSGMETAAPSATNSSLSLSLSPRLHKSVAHNPSRPIYSKAMCAGSGPITSAPPRCRFSEGGSRVASSWSYSAAATAARRRDSLLGREGKGEAWAGGGSNVFAPERVLNYSDKVGVADIRLFAQADEEREEEKNAGEEKRGECEGKEETIGSGHAEKPPTRRVILSARIDSPPFDLLGEDHFKSMCFAATTVAANNEHNAKATSDCCGIASVAEKVGSHPPSFSPLSPPYTPSDLRRSHRRVTVFDAFSHFSLVYSGGGLVMEVLSYANRDDRPIVVAIHTNTRIVVPPTSTPEEWQDGESAAGTAPHGDAETDFSSPSPPPASDVDGMAIPFGPRLNGQRPAILRIIRSHQCNDLCRLLQLPPMTIH